MEIGATEIKNLRQELGMSQPEFAEKIKTPVGTLRNWEQGRRKLGGPEQVLFKLLTQNHSLIELL